MFNWFYDAFEAIRDFMELGGDVLFLIALTIFLMWMLVFERLVFYRSSSRTGEALSMTRGRRAASANPGRHIRSAIG